MTVRIEHLSYGGGRATVAMCILVADGILPKPDNITIADTGREARSTFDYLDEFVRPMLSPLGLSVDIAPHSLATVDLYSHKGTLLVPAFTKTGKLDTYCSSEWKAMVIQRHLRSKGYEAANIWIGYTVDEAASRISPDKTKCWTKVYPLVERMLTREDCETIIKRRGWPLPPRSSCFMCPHRSNEEWRLIRDKYPDQWAEACRIDNEIREEDEMGGVWLHASRVPLSEADIERNDRREPLRQCGLGGCFT